MPELNVPIKQADELGICPESAEYYNEVHPEGCVNTPEEAKEVQDGRKED